MNTQIHLVVNKAILGNLENAVNFIIFRYYCKYWCGRSAKIIPWMLICMNFYLLVRYAHLIHEEIFDIFMVLWRIIKFFQFADGRWILIIKRISYRNVRKMCKCFFLFHREINSIKRQNALYKNITWRTNSAFLSLRN